MSLPHTEQHRAADPAHSAWVAASAGTGKTRTLTNRVLRLLLTGAAPEKILCLTFTRAAAAEMALRIQQALRHWASAADDVLTQELTTLTGAAPDLATQQRARRLFLQLLDMPRGMAIQTIHGFCQTLLARFPLEAGVSPRFQVVDERTQRELLAEARMRFLKQVTEPGSATLDRRAVDAAERLAWRFHDVSFGVLLDMLIQDCGRLHRALEQGSVDALSDHLDDWLGLTDQTLTDDQYLACWCGVTPEAERAPTEHAALLSARVQQRQLQMQALSQATDMLLSDSRAAASDLQRIRSVQDWVTLPVQERIAAQADYALLFLTRQHQPRKTLLTKKLREAHPEFLALLEEEQQQAMACQMQLQARRTARISRDLLHVGEAIFAFYRQLKEARTLLDYDDLILAANRLLHERDDAAWVLYKLDGGIDHMLVDEAQDTSPEQWQVIQAICAEYFVGEGQATQPRTLFAVGDAKQSIFSFQGAAPLVFQQMQAHFASRARAAGLGWQSVTLDHSFRSTPPILTLVDRLFAAPERQSAVLCMPEGAEDVRDAGPSDRIQHHPMRKDAPGRVELWPLLTPPEETTEPTTTGWQLPLTPRPTHDPDAILATQIAQTIRHWLDTQRSLPARDRPIQPGDILILVRSRSGFVNHMVRALKQQQIPTLGIDRLMLHTHIAVQDLLALGQFLLLPQDDLNLAALLKTPLIGLAEDHLFTLAYDRGQASLWQRLQDHARQSTPVSDTEDTAASACRTATQSAYIYLSDLLQRVDYVRPYELYAHVLHVQEGRRCFAARLGEEVHDLLDAFLERTLEYEQGHTPSLQGFLYWMQHGTTPYKRDADQEGKGVRLMTVHGAKGLQAPIVFLPDTTRLPSMRKQRILWTDATPSLPLWAGSTAEEPPPMQALRQRISDQAYDEYLRLLYVALTRAEDELYLCGTAKSDAAPAGSWYQLAQETLAACGNTQTDIDGTAPLVMPTAVLASPPPPSTSISDTTTTHLTDASPPTPDVSLTLPAYLTTPAAYEAPPATLTPSQLATEDALPQPHLHDTNPSASLTPAATQTDRTTAITTGTVTHRLLEILPSLAPERQEEAARRFCHTQALDDVTCDQLISDVLAILHHPDYAPLFAATSEAEVAVAGTLGTQRIQGRIDRLVVVEGEVWIVDYKTGAHIPATPAETAPAYLQQMSLYRQLLNLIYPTRQVRSFLLWTHAPVLMELPDTLLREVVV